MRIGIICGVEAEAAAFLPEVQSKREDWRGIPVRLVALGGHELAICCPGIGKVNAAIAAVLLAKRHRPKLLIAMGTAGRLSAIRGNCFVIREAIQHDYGASRAAAFVHYSAGAWPIGAASLEPFVAFPLPDIGLPHARIVSGDVFVEDPGHAARLQAELGADLVDMETAAMAQAATRLGLAWAAIKSVTDDADTDSSVDFVANLAEAARTAAMATERVIALL